MCGLAGCDELVGHVRSNREASKRHRAWVDAEQEIRLAIEAGVPPDEIAEAIGAVLRRRGLDSMADRVILAGGKARR
jgi:hypothetical protein